jgi:cyclophilin family peptidyl-prolyl cis-trans isomerase
MHPLFILSTPEEQIMSQRKHPAQEKVHHAAKSKKRYHPGVSQFVSNHFVLIAISVFVILLGVLIWLLMSSGEIKGPAPLPIATAAAVTSTQAAPAELTAPTATTAAAKPAAKQYDKEPAMTIDQSKKYTATVKMARGGEFVIQLYPDKAPRTVNSFVFLAREGYFNGVTFHRVLEGFMAQGGDPTGTGAGGPGYEFVNENSDLTFDKAGVVAMANAGPDTNGSQFFITFGPTPQLNGGYTIFGQVISGMDVVNGLTRRDPNANPTFQGDVISSITITEK